MLLSTSSLNVTVKQNKRALNVQVILNQSFCRGISSAIKYRDRFRMAKKLQHYAAASFLRIAVRLNS